MGKRWLVVLGVAACGGDPAAVFGHSLVPPAPLDQLRPGMPFEEVKRLFPDLEKDPGRGWIVARPTKGVTLHVLETDDRVAYTYADLAGRDGKQILTTAWGPPDAAPDVDHEYMLAWRSTATGWRAGLFCGDGNGTIDPFCNVQFHPYRPLAEMFARPIAPPAPFAPARWGMTRDELAKVTGASGTASDLAFEGVRARHDYRHDRLWRLSFAVPAKAHDLAVEHWGPPTIKTDDALTWIDPSTGWRATLHGAWLDYVSIISPRQMLDSLEALRGSSIEAIRAARSDLYFDDTTLWLPPLDVLAPGQDVTYVNLFSGVLSVGIHRNALQPGGLEAILGALASKWGQPTNTTKDHYTTRRYGAHATEMDSDRVVAIDLD